MLQDLQGLQESEGRKEKKEMVESQVHRWAQAHFRNNP